MSYTRDREEFCHVMAGESMSLPTCRQIMRDARTVQRYAEAECNRLPTARETSRAGAARLRIEEATRTLGIGVEFSGDPRGACVKLRLPSGRGNDWGGIGLHCVPT